MASQEIEEMKTLFRQRYSALNDELNSLCNMCGVSQDRRKLIIDHINFLLDMKSNMMVATLIDNGIINEKPTEDSLY